MIQKMTCAVLMAAACLGWLARAEAAESYDNCTGFVDSVPAVITTQGTWCLRMDLSTAMDSGNAIEIATNNVTLDCNDFKIGGLGAGPATQAIGIHASERANTTVRHCNVRGFSTGVQLRGSGHLVEGNTLDSNTTVGIQVYGTDSEVRDNRVLDTGGGTPQGKLVLGIAVGIGADGAAESGNSVDVVGNHVNGVVVGVGTLAVHGISVAENGQGSIVANRISGLVPPGAGSPHFGIFAIAPGNNGLVIARNTVQGLGLGGTGIACVNVSHSAHANVVRGFGTAILNCFSTGNTVASN